MEVNFVKPFNHAFSIVDLFASDGLTYVTIIRMGWISKGQQQCWVPHPNSYSKHITKTDSPGSDWMLYPCAIRKGYDSYEDARRHLGEATSKSDIDSTDIEQQPMGRGHRKKSANTRYSPYKEITAAVAVRAATSGEDSDDSSVGFYGPTQSTLPSIPVPSQLLPRLTSDSLQLVCGNQSDPLVHNNTNEKNGYKSPEVVAISSTLTTAHHEELKSNVRALQSIANETNKAVSRLQILPPVNTPKQDVDTISIPGPYLTSLVREVSKIGESQNMILKKLTEIEVRMINQEKGQSIEKQTEPARFELIDNICDLVKFEETLKEADNFYAVVRCVRGLSGASLADAVKRAWGAYLTLKCKSFCNWEGKPRKDFQKHGLQNSLLTEAIFKGISGSKAFQGTNKFEMEHETKKIMKNAPELYQRTKQTSEKQQKGSGKENKADEIEGDGDSME